MTSALQCVEDPAFKYRALEVAQVTAGTPPKFARKTVIVNSKPRIVSGLRDADPYFASVCDGFEGDFALFCERYVGDDYVCLDIGANIGITSMILSDYSPSGRVIAVEPNADVSRALQQNIAANGLNNVTALRTAIGDSKGTARFNANSAFGHISESGVEVPLTTLGDLVTELALPRVDFVKIDVEGYEPVILRDAIEVLNAQGALVYLEFNSWCLIALSKTNPSEFLDWIFDKFEFVFVVRHGEDVLLERLPRSGVRGFLYNNLLNCHCLNDLVVTNDGRRLEHSLAFADKRFLAVQSARDALAAERDALTAERSALIAERDAWAGERSALITERDALAAERSVLIAERDASAAERSALITERDASAAERSALITERDASAAERHTLITERDALMAERSVLVAERDQAIREHEALRSSTCWRVTAPLRRAVSAVRRPGL